MPNISSQRITIAALGGRGQRLFYGPPALNSRADSLNTNSGYFSPFAHEMSFSGMLKKNTVPFISRLFKSRRPSAVFRRVVGVIVDPIYRVRFAWRMPHVVQEILERISPRIADLYSASAVASKALIGGVIAASKHIAPRLVLLRRPAAVRVCGVPMLNVRRMSPLYLEASARLSVSVPKLGGANYRCFPARANTVPSDSLSGIGAAFNGSKSVELLTAKVNEIRHGWTLS